MKNVGQGETVSTKNAKLSQVWSWAPVIPATRDAEDQHLKNHLNLGGGGYSEQRSCHWTPAWVTRAKLCLKKKVRKQMLERVWRNRNAFTLLVGV